MFVVCFHYLSLIDEKVLILLTNLQPHIMQKNFFITFFVALISINGISQTLYTFSSDPLSNGWTYFDDYNSTPYPGFEYDAANQRIEYKLQTTVDASFVHIDLPEVLSENYCVSFKITPTNSNNYNTFFPLILTPYELTGTDLHPWRQNPISSTVAGPMQNIDFLALEVMSSQVRFFNRDNDINSPTMIQSLVPEFYLSTGVSYWVELEITNSTEATVRIFSDAAMSNQLASTSYIIPLLDDMTHMYISNSNGNTSCTQFGFLDDYSINRCSTLDLNELFMSQDREAVRYTDMLGRDIEPELNTPMIVHYNDGSTKKVILIQD